MRRRDHEPGIESHVARDIGDRRRRDDASRRDLGAGGMHSARQLALDPLARLSGVAADDEIAADARALLVDRPIARTSAPPKTGDRFVVERVVSRSSADAVSAKKSMGHVCGFVTLRGAT